MGGLLYDIFIYPIEIFMALVLNFVLSRSGSHIFALICVSLCVCICSLPFYHIAEIWQDREREMQKKLAPKIKEFKSVFSGAELNSYIWTLYRQNSYHPIMAVRTSFGLLIQIPFFFAAYHLLSNFSGFSGVSAFIFDDLGKADALLRLGNFRINIMPFVMTGINLLSAAVYGKKIGLREKLQLYGMAMLFLVLLYNSPSALLFYWTCNNLFSLFKNLVYRKIYRDGIITKRVHSMKLPFVEKIAAKIPPKQKIHDHIFRLSLAAFSLLAFVAVPFALLSSGSKSDFEGSLCYFSSYLILFSLIFYCLGAVLYRVLHEKLQVIFSFLLFFILLCSLVNVFAFTGDYGDMSHFVFNEEFSVDTADIIISAVIIAVIFAISFLLFFRTKLSFAKPFFGILLCALALFSIKGMYEYSAKQEVAERVVRNKTANEYYFTFSRHEKNVVVLMLDRFIGGYMPQILEFMPELKEELSGFTWYQNSLSQASYTIGGVTAIMGGWDYTIKNVNETRSDVPLAEKLDESIRIMPYNFDKAGYHVTVYQNDVSKWFNAENGENLGNSVFREPDYAKYKELWLAQQQKHINSDPDSVRKLLLMFGVFRISPSFMRGYIYDNADWHILGENDAEITKDPDYVYNQHRNPNEQNSALRNYAMLDLLPELSEAKENVGKRFYYMNNDLPHEYYLVNNNFEIELSGDLRYPAEIYRKFGKNMGSVKHLYTDAAALRLVAKWLRWMKENKVYDNTRIIIVSDHGRNVYDPYFKGQKIKNARKSAHPGYFDNLLLVKDFGKSGPLHTSQDFMTPADVPALAMEGIIEGTNPYTGNRIESPKQKFPFYFYDIQWRFEKQDKYKFKYYEKYMIEKESDLKYPQKWKVLK